MKTPLSLLILSIFILSTPSILVAEESMMSHYSNPGLRLELRYPSDWTKNEGVAGSVATFLAHKEAGKDSFSENVNVLVQDLSKQPMNLAEYTDFSVNQLKQMVHEIQIEKIEDAQLGGQPAKRIVYSGKDTEGKMMKYVQMWTIKDKKVYLIGYTAELLHFDKYASQAQEMMESFKFI